MILNPFPFPAMKECSEAHPLHFASLFSLHNNYFSVLPFKTKQISLLKQRREKEGFFYQSSFCSLSFTYKGWFTVSCFLAMGSSTRLLSPPRVIQNSCHVSQSLYELIIPHLLKGELTATRILIKVTQASWITAWGLLSRLWRRCCFLRFSITFPHSTRLSRLKGVFNFSDIQGHYSRP